MRIKIKDSLVVEANVNRIKAYLLSSALRKETCTDKDIKKAYNMSDADYDAAIDVLMTTGIVEKKTDPV